MRARGRQTPIRLAVSLAGAVLVAACGPALPGSHRPTQVPLVPSPAVTPGAVVSSGIPPTPSTPPIGVGPTSSPTLLPVHLAGADWPLTASSTFDPGLVLHVPILMYHRIASPAEAGESLPGLVVAPTLFAAQLSLLARAGWHTITLATLQADLAAGRRPPPRTFVITIDDGHRDGLTNGLPILQEFGFVATYFVIMGRIHDPRYLGPADLQTLADDGMEIADHTMSHVDLINYHGAGLAWQIGQAGRTIAQITGRPPTSFAYPFGDWSLEAAGAVQADDLGMAVTTQSGVLETWSNRFFVPRLRVSPSVSPTGLLRLVSGYATG